MLLPCLKMRICYLGGAQICFMAASPSMPQGKIGGNLLLGSNCGDISKLAVLQTYRTANSWSNVVRGAKTCALTAELKHGRRIPRFWQTCNNWLKLACRQGRLMLEPLCKSPISTGSYRVQRMVSIPRYLHLLEHL